MSSKINPNFKVWFSSKLYALIPLLHHIVLEYIWSIWLCCTVCNSKLLQKMYSRIPLIHHPQAQKGARLSHILDYQTAPTITQVLIGNFCWCSSTWVIQLITVFHLDISFSCWFRNIRAPFYIFSTPFSTRDVKTRRLLIRSLHGWRSWWRKRQGVKQYRNILLSLVATVMAQWSQ
jgi:hypothetical protein